jgi:hypothetical protein
VYRITELKKRPGSNKGYRAIEEWTNGTGWSVKYESWSPCA